MSGVLKDILLVAASMAIFRDPVTGQQFFGYSITLAGLVYYKLGGDNVKSVAANAVLRVETVRQNHPARVKAAAWVSAGLAVVFLYYYWTENISDATGRDILGTGPS